MRKLILASHGELANGMLDSIKMIVGDLAKGIETYTLKPGLNTDDYVQQLEIRVKDNPDEEYVIVTDLYGASVANSMLKLSVYDNVVVFTGLTSALVLDLLLSHSDKLNNESIQEILETTKQSINHIKIDQSLLEEEDF